MTIPNYCSTRLTYGTSSSATAQVCLRVHEVVQGPANRSEVKDPPRKDSLTPQLPRGLNCVSHMLRIYIPTKFVTKNRNRLGSDRRGSPAIQQTSRRGRRHTTSIDNNSDATLSRCSGLPAVPLWFVSNSVMLLPGLLGAVDRGLDCS